MILKLKMFLRLFVLIVLHFNYCIIRFWVKKKNRYYYNNFCYSSGCKKIKIILFDPRFSFEKIDYFFQTISYVNIFFHIKFKLKVI